MKPSRLLFVLLFIVAIDSCKQKKENEPMFKPMELTINEKQLEVKRPEMKLELTAITNPKCDIQPNTRFAIRFDEFVNSILLTTDRVNKLDASTLKIKNIKISTNATQKSTLSFGAKLFGDIIEATSENSKETARTLTYSITTEDDIVVSINSKSFLDSLKTVHDKTLNDYLAARSVLYELYDNHSAVEDGIVERRQEQEKIVANLDCLEKKSRILYNIYKAKADFENKLFEACNAAIENYNYLIKAVPPSTATCFTVDFAVTFTTDNKFGFAFTISGGYQYTGSNSNEVVLIFGDQKSCL